LRRKINPLYSQYHVGCLPTYGSLLRQFRKWGFEVKDLADDGWFHNTFRRCLFEFVGRRPGK
jgi:hypothetical protein